MSIISGPEQREQANTDPLRTTVNNYLHSTIVTHLHRNNVYDTLPEKDNVILNWESMIHTIW
jgi:hypothetical protein